MEAVVNQRGAPAEIDPAVGKRVGWAVAALVNLVLIYVVNHLLDWGFPSFLTEAFNDVTPAITLSLWVAVAVNAARVLYGAPRFVAATEIVTLVVNIWATLRIWDVFPLEFDDGTPWSTMVRAVLVIAILGSLVSIVVQVTRILQPDRS